MSKRYRGNCDFCGRHYEGFGKQFCSRQCHVKFETPYRIQAFSDHFWSRIRQRGECWEWMGARGAGGYGTIGFKFHRMRIMATHRLAYALVHGGIPVGMFVCHHCDNPPCVRPSHLFLGTKADNTRDMWQKNRRQSDGHFLTEWALGHPELILRGERCPWSKLTRRQVDEIRQCYQHGRFSQRRLAKKYGVSHATINHIVNEITWKNG